MDGEVRVTFLGVLLIVAAILVAMWVLKALSTEPNDPRRDKGKTP